MLFLLTFGCRSAEPSWDLFTSVEVECEPSGDAAEPTEELPRDPEWAEAMRRAACAEDPLNCEDEPEVAEETATGPESDPEAEADPELAEAEGAGEEAEAEEASTEAPTTVPLAIGLPEQPNWGVRLLQTLPTAQPPRAALGLSDGTELVVSPGSMIPEAGIIVVSVGDGVAQVATVEAAGDHAEIETLTLHAQY